MKRKLKGAYFFEWLGRTDRSKQLRTSNARNRSDWPEWACEAYIRGYYYTWWIK